MLGWLLIQVQAMWYSFVGQVEIRLSLAAVSVGYQEGIARKLRKKWPSCVVSQCHRTQQQTDNFSRGATVLHAEPALSYYRGLDRWVRCQIAQTMLPTTRH